MLTFKEPPKKKWYAVILSRYRNGHQESTKAVCKASNEYEALSQIHCMGRSGWHVVNMLVSDNMHTLTGEEPMTPKQLSNKRSELMQMRYEREHAANLERKRELARAEREEFEQTLAQKQQEARERARAFEEAREPRHRTTVSETSTMTMSDEELEEYLRTYEPSIAKFIDILRSETPGNAA